MKSVSIALTLVLVLCFSWIACKKRNNAPVYPRGMTAKINGTLWTAATIICSSSGNYLRIAGSDSLGQTIDIRMNNFRTKGAFNVQQENDSILFYPLVISSGTPTGTLSIQTVNDTSISGTFSFTLKSYFFGSGNIVVTNGTFNWNYK